jgi:hypothetical protein
LGAYCRLTAQALANPAYLLAGGRLLYSVIRKNESVGCGLVYKTSSSRAELQPPAKIAKPLVEPTFALEDQVHRVWML